MCQPASQVPEFPALAFGLQKEHPVQSHSNILDGYTSSLDLHLEQEGPGSFGSRTFGIKVSSSTNVQCLADTTFLLLGRYT